MTGSAGLPTPCPGWATWPGTGTGSVSAEVSAGRRLWSTSYHAGSGSARQCGYRGRQNRRGACREGSVGNDKESNYRVNKI